ncbi:MAG TPA: NifB/NifX family molybdenum-iron cluster-binding protein [Clostridia bacterium]|nr:NifB/NifX family molybdenum-iron cluster-binding protein [Clostridia bacterium]
MKIAIPVNEKSMEKGVCISFGRAPYFLIYDRETKESTFVENTAANSQGGAGIKAAQLIADNGVDTLITPRCGEKAVQVISIGKIEMYKTINDNIQDNINAFNDGKLSLLDELHAGLHNHGGSN